MTKEQLAEEYCENWAKYNHPFIRKTDFKEGFLAGFDAGAESERFPKACSFLSAQLGIAESKIIELERQLADQMSGCCDCPLFKESNSKLQAAESKLKIACEALEFYANRMSYTIDSDTSINGMTRRVCLFSDQEEFNQCSTAAGRKAREALRKIGETCE